jgi:hypothetical protein
LPSIKQNARIHKEEKFKQSPVSQDKIYNQYSISNKSRLVFEGRKDLQSFNHPFNSINQDLVGGGGGMGGLLRMGTVVENNRQR